MADPESQTSPLAPAGVNTDEHPFTSTAVFTKPKHQKANKSLVHILATVVLLGTIFLIFASVCLRVVNPKLRLHTVSIQSFQYGNMNGSNSTSLNVTMLTEVTVNNRNFGRYVFENCNAVVLYGNSVIGGGAVSGGSVGARESKSIGVVMRIGYEGLNISRDGMGVMEFRSYAKMTGRVQVMKMVDRSETIEMDCVINLNMTSRSFMNSVCS